MLPALEAVRLWTWSSPPSEVLLALDRLRVPRSAQPAAAFEISSWVSWFMVLPSHSTTPVPR